MISAGEGFEEGLGFGGILERPDVADDEHEGHDDAGPLQGDAAGGALVVGEAIGPQHGAGVNAHAAAQLGAGIEHDIGEEHAAIADLQA